MAQDLHSLFASAVTHAPAATLNDVEQVVAQGTANPCSAWESYVLVAMLQHTRRQRWLASIVRELGGDEQAIGKRGYAGHPSNIPQRGSVAHAPGWSYDFHGIGCCLTHKDGTTLDVDFGRDGNAEEIDIFFFNLYLKTATKLERAGQQLRFPEGLEESWHVDLPSLVARGLLVEQGRHRFTPEGWELAEGLEQMVDALDESPTLSQIYLLCVMGDYMGALGVHTHGDTLPGNLTIAARAQEEQRISFLRTELHANDGLARPQAIGGLARIRGEEAIPEMVFWMKREVREPVALRALDALRHWKTKESTAALEDTLKSLDQGSAFRPLRGKQRIDDFGRLRIGITEELLSRYSADNLPARTRRSILQALTRDSDCDSPLTSFLLLLIGECSSQDLAASLASELRRCRIDAATYLALVADQASVATLIAASEGAAELGGHEAICALRLISSTDAKAAVQSWEIRHPDYERGPADTDSPAQSWEQMDRVSLSQSMPHELARARMRYGQLVEKWLPNRFD
jgi:hypothetical protein